jgi:hypothetical protein
LKDDNLKVYYKKKKSGTYDDKDYFPWERKFLNKKVDCEHVRKNQRKLIMDLDFFQFGELIDIKAETGSHFIHSMTSLTAKKTLKTRSCTTGWITSKCASIKFMLQDT